MAPCAKYKVSENLILIIFEHFKKDILDEVCVLYNIKVIFLQAYVKHRLQYISSNVCLKNLTYTSVIVWSIINIVNNNFVEDHLSFNRSSIPAIY